VKDKLGSILKFCLYLFVFIFCQPTSAVTDKEFCDLRADLMLGVAQARDEGVPKRQVRKFMEQKSNIKLPPTFDVYVDAVYENRKYKPNELKTISLYSCYKEFGILK
jgi:ferric iron reductase protein FhuF